ncbi:MAG: hypothetical protein GY846_07745 [Deltaproteobacteria bacterium]|nr:hypothetical protein [Deltaproteobacteria bacterium]
MKIASLSKNSTNSSKKPSSDDLTKKKPKKRGGEKRKPGGQPGHPIHERPLLPKEDIPPEVVKQGLFKSRLTATVAYMSKVCHSIIKFFLREGPSMPRFYISKKASVPIVPIFLLTYAWKMASAHKFHFSAFSPNRPICTSFFI